MSAECGGWHLLMKIQMGMIKKCIVCGKIFYPTTYEVNRGYGKFCSRKCMGKYYSQERKGEKSVLWKGGKIKKRCIGCGKMFNVFPSRTNTRKFCSRECRGKVIKVCVFCGKEFNVYQCRIKTGDGKFCSKKCFHHWKKENIRGERHYNWQGGKIERKCVTCGKSFKIFPSQVRGKKGGYFCSISCRSLYFVKHTPNKNTSIELKVEEYLKKLGIIYEAQKIIPEGRTVSDFYIPEQRLVIYADGFYWHSLPKAKNRDCKHDFLLGMNGYKVLRLAENEINNNPKKCMIKISNLLSDKPSGGD
jgi:very-short-patch-repair endonuclease